MGVELIPGVWVNSFGNDAIPAAFMKRGEGTIRYTGTTCLVQKPDSAMAVRSFCHFSQQQG
jgi:hypothetical protein